MQKSKIVRWGIALLILVTVLSRPVMNALTAKVSFVEAREGEIKFTLIGRNPRWHAGESLEIALALETNLRVDEILVKPMQTVSQGDALVQSEPITSENRLLEAQKELYNCEQSLKSGGYDVEQMRFLKQDFENAQQKVTILSQLSQNNWQLLTLCEGFVSEIFVQKGAQYTGIDPILVIEIPNDTVLCSAEISALDLTGFTLQAILTVDGKTTSRLPVEISENICTLELPYTSEIPQNATLEIECVNHAAGIVVPNGALQGGGIYVINETTGLWDTEYVLEERFVQIGQSDSQRTAILSGLTRGEKVLLMSDRPVQNGDRVMLR